MLAALAGIGIGGAALAAWGLLPARAAGGRIALARSMSITIPPPASFMADAEPPRPTAPSEPTGAGARSAATAATGSADASGEGLAGAAPAFRHPPCAVGSRVRAADRATGGARLTCGAGARLGGRGPGSLVRRQLRACSSPRSEAATSPAGIRCDHVVAETSGPGGTMGSGGNGQGATRSGAQGETGGAGGGPCDFEVATLAMGPPGPLRLTADRTSIYWISDVDRSVATVSKRPPSMPAAAVTLTTSPTTPAYITSDLDRLFWTTLGSPGGGPSDAAVYRIDKTGDNLACVWQENSSNESQLGGIGIHGPNLLFARRAWEALVRAAKLDDCILPPDSTQAAYKAWPTAVVVHDGGAFFIDRPAAAASSIRRVDADAINGDAEQLGPDLDRARRSRRGRYGRVLQHTGRRDLQVRERNGGLGPRRSGRRAPRSRPRRDLRLRRQRHHRHGPRDSKGGRGADLRGRQRAERTARASSRTPPVCTGPTTAATPSWWRSIAEDPAAPTERDGKNPSTTRGGPEPGSATVRADRTNDRAIGSPRPRRGTRESGLRSC